MSNVTNALIKNTLTEFDTSFDGLPTWEIERRRLEFGINGTPAAHRHLFLREILKSLTNPFVLILIFLAAITFITDVLFANPKEEPSYHGVITLLVMVLLSVGVRLWQEGRSRKAVTGLEKMMERTTRVRRQDIRGRSVEMDLALQELVPGDIVHLNAGDLIPADVRFLLSRDVQVNESMLTGESMPVEKKTLSENAREARSLGYQGTSLVHGNGTAVVIATGAATAFGDLAHRLASNRPPASFERGVRKVGLLLVRFMLVMVPLVFVINALSTGDWLSAFLFGVATAVGLTPEMLPMIVSTNLAKGAVRMAKHRVIVKRLDAIGTLGAMDVLCTDKTGTLTQDRIALQEHLSIAGTQSPKVLKYAAINANFQTGRAGVLDTAILNAWGGDRLEKLDHDYHFISEIPFDFSRRCASVSVLDSNGEALMVTKGALEEILARCTDVEISGGVQALTPSLRHEIAERARTRNRRGYRVLAVAIKRLGQNNTSSTEEELSFLGLLTFLDPPKEDTKHALSALRDSGIAIKVVTGDNELVARSVCEQLGIPTGNVLSGARIDTLDEDQLRSQVEATTVFAKVNPVQKARVVRALSANAHTVGFLGDGINDALALQDADVGISVDTAVDVARESADVLLLEKDLGILATGVRAGRSIFDNMMKYITITASSNFGNMFSVLVSSAVLPFLPMLPAVILVQNMIYDASMMSMPWDKVDQREIARPRTWNAKKLARLVIAFGPISSIFDISTFALMWYIFGANSPEHAALFQSGWFVESLISQTLIVHMLRTRRIPFINSRASWPVIAATGLVCAIALVLPFSPVGAALGLVPLPWTYFPWLILTLGCYVVLTQLVKNIIYRKIGD